MTLPAAITDALSRLSLPGLAVIDGGRVVSEGAPGVALSPEILARVFRLDGALVETPAGPVLAARRL